MISIPISPDGSYYLLKIATNLIIQNHNHNTVKGTDKKVKYTELLFCRIIRAEPQSNLAFLQTWKQLCYFRKRGKQSILHSFQGRWKNVCLDNVLKGLHGILFKDARNYFGFYKVFAIYFSVHKPLAALQMHL